MKYCLNILSHWIAGAWMSSILLCLIWFFKINMTIIYVWVDMHHLGPWSSKWSKDLRIPDHGTMESCDPHISTGKRAHFHSSPAKVWITLPSLQLCVDYLWPTFLFLVISSLYFNCFIHEVPFYKMLLELQFKLWHFRCLEDEYRTGVNAKLFVRTSIKAFQFFLSQFLVSLIFAMETMILCVLPPVPNLIA